MVTGGALYNQGQMHYQAGRVTQAFELYRQAIIQILDHEDVLKKAPGVPEQHPQEVLAIIWQNFLACFKSDDGGFTQG
jgi:hypothetical protein